MVQWAAFIHIVLAAFWVGGMIFTAAVLVPVSRGALFENRRGEFFSQIGTLFSRFSWAVFMLMLLTGVLILIGRGYSLTDLVRPWFWESGYGQILMGKLHLFSLVLILSGIHDFWLGPKAARLMDGQPGQPVTQRFRKAASWIGRVNLVLGLLILWYANQLVRGGL